MNIRSRQGSILEKVVVCSTYLSIAGTEIPMY